MKNKKIFVAGERGFVGSHIKKYLLKKGYTNIIDDTNRTNFINQSEVKDFFKINKPEILIIAAGKVGGILAHKKYPAQFLYENIMIWTNLIKTAVESNVNKIVFLGSSTIYPTNAHMPLKENSIMTGPLNQTNEPYALAKLTAIKLCSNYNISSNIDCIPLTLTNVYGPDDHFDSENSHVVPSLISKFFDAKKQNLSEVIIWGSGVASRDFVYVEDVASSVTHTIESIGKNDLFKLGVEHLNIASGVEIKIKDLVETIKGKSNFMGNIRFDKSKPDGALRRVLDIDKISSLGWVPKYCIEEGIQKTILYYNNMMETR